MSNSPPPPPPPPPLPGRGIPCTDAPVPFATGENEPRATPAPPPSSPLKTVLLADEADERSGKGWTSASSTDRYVISLSSAFIDKPKRGMTRGFRYLALSPKRISRSHVRPYRRVSTRSRRPRRSAISVAETRSFHNGGKRSATQSRARSRTRVSTLYPVAFRGATSFGPRRSNLGDYDPRR